MSQTETKRDKRYNLTGVITDLKVTTTADGKTRAGFRMVKQDGRSKGAVAFDAKADALLAAYGEGSTVKLFGYFESRTFTGNDGKKVTYSRMNVLWAGDPSTAETDAEQATAQQADLVDQAAQAAASEIAAETSTEVAEEAAESVDPHAARREELDGLTKAKLMELSETEFGYELSSKTNKPEMIDQIVRMENGEMVHA